MAKNDLNLVEKIEDPMTEKEYIDDIVRILKVVGIRSAESTRAYYENFSKEALRSLWAYLYIQELAWKRRHKEL